MKKALLGVAVLSAALVSAGTAFAEDRHEQQASAFGPSQRVEAQLAYLHTALKITDAQQAQWNAFADGMRKQAAERDQKMREWREQAKQRHDEMASGGNAAERHRATPIERLDREQQMHASAIARINEQLAVEKPLYDSLSPEQKKIADVVLEPRHRGRFGRDHRWGGRDRA